MTELTPSTGSGQAAGRELDALIAEKVMGWEWREREYNPAVFGDNPPTYHVWWDNAIDNVPALCLTEKTNYNTDYTPPFSTDISAAWQVVEKLKEKYRVSIHSLGDGWQCALEIKDGTLRYPGMDIAHDGDVYAEGEITMAICLAALKTIEATQKEKTLCQSTTASKP